LIRRDVEMTLQMLLLAFATFRQKVQPEWYAHIHSHGHATARLARSFTAACFKTVQKSTLDEIEFGAHMHDVGKYLIRREILLKPDVLEEDERAIMALHPVHGAQILRGLPYMTTTIAQVVLHHHERWDGTGYPEGLAGNAIPFAARVVAVADVYTSLRARRSYKTALTRSGACAILKTMAGHELDPNMVHDFVSLVEGQVKMRIANGWDSETRARSTIMREALRAVLD
jgi:HD-GYP domain-containing protein (c-di-GMP phosphodiesterase class II)